MGFWLNATEPAAAVTASLDLAASTTRVGDWVYLTPRLLDTVGNPADTLSGVTLSAIGSASGASNVTMQQADTRLWRARFEFARQEAVAFELRLRGALVSRQSLTVAGVAPSFINTSATLAAARLVVPSLTSSSATTSAPVAPGAALVVPTARAATVEMPVLTVAGGLWLTDPGLSVSLTLVPSALLESVDAATSAAGATVARRLHALHQFAEEGDGQALSQAQEGRRHLQQDGDGLDAGDKDHFASEAGGAAQPRQARRRLEGSSWHGRQLLQTYYDSEAWDPTDAAAYGSSYTQAYDYPGYTGAMQAWLHGAAAGLGLGLGCVMVASALPLVHFSPKHAWPWGRHGRRGVATISCDADHPPLPTSSRPSHPPAPHCLPLPRRRPPPPPPPPFTGEFAAANVAGYGLDPGGYLADASADPSSEPQDPFWPTAGSGGAYVLNTDVPGGLYEVQDSLANLTGVLTFQGGPKGRGCRLAIACRLALMALPSIA